MDWRKKVELLGIEIPEGARGLGAIEGNESNLFADRMKELIQLNKLNSEGDWWEAWSGSETLTKQHKSQEKPAKR